MSSAQQRTPESIDPLVIAFNKIDVDGSGTITSQEFFTRLHEEGFDMGKEEFDTLFEFIDKDNSGSIDFNEYCLFMNKVQEAQNMGGNNNRSRRKSVMKVSTQTNSLNSSTDTGSSSNRRRSQMKKKMSSRASKFLSTRKMMNFREHNLDLDRSSSKVKPERSSSLRFFDVEVREYDVTVSDNPGVKSGVAIELGWDYNVSERTHIDNFEERRSKERSTNFMKEKKLTKHEREKILRQFGASEKEIQEATKRAATIRNKRKKSIEMRHNDALNEKVERRVSGIKEIFSRRGSSKANKRQSQTAEIIIHPTLMAMMGVDDSERSGYGCSMRKEESEVQVDET